MKEKPLALIETHKIRRHYNETTETWFFSVVDIIQVLIQQPDYQTARNYWKVLKNLLNKEGSVSSILFSSKHCSAGASGCCSRKPSNNSVEAIFIDGMV